MIAYYINIYQGELFKMKKMFSMVMILALILAFTACSSGPPAESESSSSTEKVEEAAPVAEEVHDGDAAAGEKLFTQTCAACHGAAGEGVTGLGKDMTTSEFIAGKSATELVDFIKVGRDPSDPLNTTGVAMPVKGGNPALSDDDLYDIVAFIDTLQK